MVSCLEDPMLFMRTFLPHWFGKKIPWVHRGLTAILLRQTDFLLQFGKESWPLEPDVEWTPEELQKILKFFVWRSSPKAAGIPLFRLVEFEFPGEDEPRQRIDLYVTNNTQVVMPRGFGKTSVINACNLIKTVYKLRRFIVYLSETATHANKQLDNIKRELTSNERLLAVFGTQKPQRNDDEIWRQDFFETTGGVAFAGRGRGGHVRGLRHNSIRPDDITIDDVEDQESVETDDQRDKTKDWFFGDVMPAGNQITKDTVFNLVGTLLHKEALIPSLIGDPDWTSVVFGALDPEGQPLWPEYMDEAGIQAKKLTYARLGKLALFYMEFLSKLTVGEAAKFKGPFRYQLMQKVEFIARALVIDPAISKKENADFCCLGVTGVTDRGQHHVLDMRGRKGMTPREQIDEFFELHFLWDTTHNGVESIAYQMALVHLIREEQFRKAKFYGPKAYFEVTPITHGAQGKIPRVEGILQPRYSSGYITHQKIFPELETQLLEWPNDKKDFPDVVAMCISLLDPFAAAAFDTTKYDGAGIAIEGVSDPLAADIYEALDPAEYLSGAP
jgi:hypothetical protein